MVDPNSVLAWLQRLARARIVALTPRTVREVQDLLACGVAADLDELGMCLTALLAQDRASARQIAESFREWRAECEGELASKRATWVVRLQRRVERFSVRQWIAVLLVGVVAGVAVPLLVLKLVERCPSAPVVEPEADPVPEVVASGTEETILSPIEAGRAFGGEPDQHKDVLVDVPAPEPWVVAVLGLASILLAGLAVRWWLSIEEHRRDIEQAHEQARDARARALESTTRLAIPYHIPVSPPLAVHAVEASATILARVAADHPGWQLDVEPTVARTIDAGGFVRPVFRPVRQHAAIVVLVDVERDGHPDLFRVNRLLELWRRGGLVFTRYDFEYRPDVLLTWPKRNELDLSALAKRHRGAPLLLISRCNAPAGKDGRLDWPERLVDWPGRAWLDLDPRTLDERTRDARAHRRTLEASGLRRFPFTDEGLLACAQTLAASGQHAAPLDEHPLRPAAEVALSLELWAACACLVPDPKWAQLDAFRRALPELAAELPDPRYVHRLIEWLHHRAHEHGWGDTSRLGHGDRLEVLPAQLDALREQLRRHDEAITSPSERLEPRAWELLEAQLLAADVSGDPFGAQLRDLKLDVIRALLHPEQAKELPERWRGKAVEVELAAMLAPERRLHDEGLALGPGWGTSFWKEHRATAIGRAGAGVASLLQSRPWTRRRVVAVGMALAVVTAGYGAWWRMWPGRVGRQVLVRGSREVIPPRWEVQTREVVDCEDEVALVGLAPLRMKCVRGGKFLMGSLPGEVGRGEDEGPQHIAEVRSLLVGETEVTQGQWHAVMGTTKVFDEKYGRGDDYPANGVSWNEAVEFMNVLTARENALRGEEPQMTACYAKDGESWAWENKDCTGYRLPTETEWEYAARAGTTTAYGFGEDPKELCKHGNGADLSLKRGDPEAAKAYEENNWSFLDCDDGAVGLANVGSYQANAWGLYDMHGNVWEWVGDWYADTYPSEATPAAYAGPDSGEYRVLRGGSFWNFPLYLRSAYRDRYRPTGTDENDGFRCVRVL